MTTTYVPAYKGCTNIVSFSGEKNLALMWFGHIFTKKGMSPDKGRIYQGLAHAPEQGRGEIVPPDRPICGDLHEERQGYDPRRRDPPAQRAAEAPRLIHMDKGVPEGARGAQKPDLRQDHPGSIHTGPGHAHVHWSIFQRFFVNLSKVSVNLSEVLVNLSKV